VARLDGAVARFESALQTFATTTRDFHEFNVHLKDNDPAPQSHIRRFERFIEISVWPTIPGRKL